ncbi:hypothetical protein C8R31_101634 [Nitrosospira sp. Nsp2]|uniref:hypothetical protein n=1 Tax=Nitrosospira sp. Nsp2 TaxID=136548 RepID=UPI000D31F052|nr:hypothetical protein [Nitrosospira sp. Nsp2]PTR17470.1 hypothetical protein C8R31_101634 [Nitrosospira sp. Nsp2]
MKNITELRAQLSTLFADLKSGSIDVKIASEMNNTAGKIINSLKVELDYAAQRKEEPSIEFLKQSNQ